MQRTLLAGRGVLLYVYGLDRGPPPKDAVRKLNLVASPRTNQGVILRASEPL
jgi:hypothetical protein